MIQNAAMSKAVTPAATVPPSKGSALATATTGTGGFANVLQEWRSGRGTDIGGAAANGNSPQAGARTVLSMVMGTSETVAPLSNAVGSPDQQIGGGNENTVAAGTKAASVQAAGSEADQKGSAIQVRQENQGCAAPEGGVSTTTATDTDGGSGAVVAKAVGGAGAPADGKIDPPVAGNVATVEVAQSEPAAAKGSADGAGAASAVGTVKGAATATPANVIANGTNRAVSDGIDPKAIAAQAQRPATAGTDPSTVTVVPATTSKPDPNIRSEAKGRDEGKGVRRSGSKQHTETELAQQTPPMASAQAVAVLAQTPAAAVAAAASAPVANAGIQADPAAITAAVAKSSDDQQVATVAAASTAAGRETTGVSAPGAVPTQKGAAIPAGSSALPVTAAAAATGQEQSQPATAAFVATPVRSASFHSAQPASGAGAAKQTTPGRPVNGTAAAKPTQAAQQPATTATDVDVNDTSSTAKAAGEAKQGQPSQQTAESGGVNVPTVSVTVKPVQAAAAAPVAAKPQSTTECEQPSTSATGDATPQRTAGQNASGRVAQEAATNVQTTAMAQNPSAPATSNPAAVQQPNQPPVEQVEASSATRAQRVDRKDPQGVQAAAGKPSAEQTAAAPKANADDTVAKNSTVGQSAKAAPAPATPAQNSADAGGKEHPEQKAQGKEAEQVLTSGIGVQTQTAVESAQPAPKAAQPQSELHQSIMSQVKDGVVVHDAKGNSQMTIRLNPEQLGELRIQVRMDDGNRVRIDIQADNSAVKDLLMSNLDSLKEALAGKNLSMDGFDVSTGGGSFNGSLPEQQGNPQQHSAPRFARGGSYGEPQAATVKYMTDEADNLLDVRF